MADEPTTDFVSREQVAQAADEVADSFMDRYRARPMGDGERFYDLYDAFSSFAQAVRDLPPVKDRQ